jgi:hypothetical protein
MVLTIELFSVWSMLQLYNEIPRMTEGVMSFWESNITKLCRRQAEVILNHENPNVRAIGQEEPRHRKYKGLKLGGGQAYDRSSV